MTAGNYKWKAPPPSGNARRSTKTPEGALVSISVVLLAHHMGWVDERVEQAPLGIHDR